jgi:FSR family fosmidomycin resistance protein-like MFS transporter
MLFYPASGAFVSLSQAALMDAEPDRHEQNMARWTFAGSVGIVIGPVLLSGASNLGANWRILFWGFAGFALLTWMLARRHSFYSHQTDDSITSATDSIRTELVIGVKQAWAALKRKDVLRWLILLEFSDLVLDVLHGYLALYFVDVAGVAPEQAGFGVAIWTGAGLLGDFLLIPLLNKVRGLDYLRVSAFLVLVIFPVFLLVPGIPGKLILAGLLGFLNAGWYAIPKGRLYTVMPNQSGKVMAIGNIFHIFGGLIPLGIGMAAHEFGLQTAMWLILLGPIALIIGLRR